MTLDEFKSSLSGEKPPADIGQLLEAMWYEGKGDWHTAHNIAQDIHSSEGSWVHAYLHRKEGDQGNAAYWYSRAGKPVFRKGLDEEWEHIVSTFLKSLN